MLSCFLFVFVCEYSCFMSGLSIPTKGPINLSSDCEAYRYTSNFVRHWPHFQYEFPVNLLGLTNKKMDLKINMI